MRLGDLLQVISGVSYDKKDISASGYRILRGGNIQQTKILLEKDDVFLPERYRDSKKEIRQGDILIVASTGSKIVIGKPGFVDHPIPNTMIGAFLRICRSYTVYTQDWLKCLFSSEFYREHIRDLAGGTNINNIRESYITEFVVPLPPLEEQKRISDKLNEIFALLDTIDSLQMQCGSNINILKDKLLTVALTGRLVEQRPEEGSAEELYCQIQEEKKRLVKEGKIKKEKPLPEITEEEEPFEIPETWKWCYIGDIFAHNTGKALNASDNEGKILPYITTSNLYWDHFKLDNLKEMPFTDSEIKKCSVKKGDLLVCEGGDFGRASIWPYDYPMRIQNHIHRLRAYIPISVQYFYYVFLLYKETGRIAGKGIGIQGLSSNMLHRLKVPLPPLEEQKRISDKLEEIMPLISSLNETPR